MSGGDNWQVGDLALCIAEKSWIGVATRQSPSNAPQCGAVYSVEEVGRQDELDWIRLTELNAKRFHTRHFRKITPPKADEFDREVIDLMLGKPVPAYA